MDIITPLKRHEQKTVHKIAVFCGLQAMPCNKSTKKGAVRIIRTSKTVIPDHAGIQALLKVSIT